MLLKDLLPAICSVSSEFFIFQQDSALAHHVKRDSCTAVNRDSRLHQSTGMATEQTGSESDGLWVLWDFAGLPLPDPQCRSSERTIDWRVASLWSEHYRWSSESVAWSTALHKCICAKGGHDVNRWTVSTDIRPYLHLKTIGIWQHYLKFD